MKEKKDKKVSKSLWYKTGSFLLSLLGIFVSIGLIVSAYAGAVNTLHHPFASVVAMTFPLWLAGIIAVVIFTLVFRPRIALIGAAGICISLPVILEFSPLHIFSPSVADDAETFTLMTYNVFGFKDQYDSYPGGVNPMISYILDKDADIVCLQEIRTLSPSTQTHVTQSQIDSLHTQYPYVYQGGHSQAIFSKFPIEPVNIGFKYTKASGASDMACFRADIRGQKVTIFNVHLQSFNLRTNEREMFLKLTKLEGSESEIKEMQHHLVDKICEAAPSRVQDTEKLIKYIGKYGGPNVIVCGDFNDVPGCYPLRMLSQQKLKEVYPEVGFGPMITYNTERFYFRIDHILYRGAMRPLSMKRCRIRASDHYPVIARFEILHK